MTRRRWRVYIELIPLNPWKTDLPKSKHGRARRLQKKHK